MTSSRKARLSGRSIFSGSWPQKAFTLPTLELDDFIGLSFVTGPDGERIYGHMDYGKRDPSLGWRFTDAWLSMAGAGDPGLPNGLPVDEWGIQMEECHPVGSSVERGGATNGPAAVYALQKYIDWLKDYAPPEAPGMNFSDAGPVPAQGQIAQQIFWYTAFTSDMTEAELPVVNEDGTPKWRMAPSPYGAYWSDGMKLGYQDMGAWTIPRVMSDRRGKSPAVKTCCPAGKKPADQGRAVTGVTAPE